jgi:Rad4 beta-hairpin domain 3/Rad4 beta-hairpin domain 1/Rad4 beta-hairpin domain 2
MSLDWNLSSDEEEAFDDWAKVDLNKSQVGDSTASARASEIGGDSSSSEEKQWSSTPFAGVAFDPDDESEDEEEDEDIDWEDAGQQDDDDGTPATTSQKLATDPSDAAFANASKDVTQNLRPVTLHFNESADVKNTKSKKKRISRKRYRYEQLTPDLQYLLSNLEKSHMLSLTATAMIISNHCSSQDVLGVAHSLIPLAWVQNPPATPTLHDLRSFCSFFFDLIHPGMHLSADAVARKPRNSKGKTTATKTLSKGAKLSGIRGQQAILYRMEEYASFLATRSQSSDLPSRLQRGDYHQYDHVQLFIAMTRSLGWRTRLVMALEPCQRDLDTNHSVFVAASARNIFQRLWKSSRSDDTKRAFKRLKMEMTSLNKNSPDSPEEGNTTKVSSWKVQELATVENELPLCWVEVLCLTSASKKDDKASAGLLRWIHLDPTRELFHMPESVEVVLHAKHEGIAFSKTKKKRPIPYALAAEHLLSTSGERVKMRLTDVTPRYSSSFVDSLKARGVVRGKQGPLRDELRADKWWVATIKSMSIASNGPLPELCVEGKTPAKAIPSDDDSDDDDRKQAAKPAVADAGMNEVDEEEEKQLQNSKRSEPIPTSKTAFKTNPVYTLPSLLNSNEVLKPDAKQRICGVFKGEFVFRRSEVETALPPNSWLYKGRKVKEVELSRPVKRVKKRSKGSSQSFQALKSYGVGKSNDGTEETRDRIIDEASKALPDGMENLYASWQTEQWSPSPVGPNDPIPANEYNNMELALLNPGLVHIDERYAAKVAKKLGIPYLPCLLGFEGHGGNRTPTIRGIIVHLHNEDILREAHVEMCSHFLQEEHENRQRAILLCWKRLMVGILTKKRLEQAYG